ncbi:MAG: aminotransferase class IV, partial [Desulfurivibrionaceae bacterium]
LSSAFTDSADPFYYHKTTCRDLYDAERESALAAGFYEVLYRNERGEMTEGGITNLFVRKNGKLLTPPLACGLLGGVFRAALLDGEVDAPEGLPVEEKVITLEDLKNAEGVYVGNSVRGLVRVGLVDDYS